MAITSKIKHDHHITSDGIIERITTTEYYEDANLLCSNSKSRTIDPNIDNVEDEDDFTKKLVALLTK